ncbi:MAG: DUF6671 family protein [Chitinophagales bacterium]
MAPLLEQHLGVKCVLPSGFDTDKLGTFTGEVERETDPLTTARKKCLMALELGLCDMAVASEGSFGAHPLMPFTPADDEWLFFMDKKNDIEVFAREVSSSTNFGGTIVRSVGELMSFANKAQFPSHGLILRAAEGDTLRLVKGITDKNILQKVFLEFTAVNGSAFVETDMRAHYNPLRMDVIEKATEKLVKKLTSTCPICDTPGFSITNARPGLPCEICNSPTKTPLYYILSCAKCGFEAQEPPANKKKFETPVFCDYCNP